MSFVRSTVTCILIIINVAVFLAETAKGGSTSTAVALKFGALYGPRVRRGEYYRLFTSMFLHFGALHLLFNMYALSELGPAVDYVCGPVIYLIVYIAAGIAGNALTLLVERRSGRNTISAGASGCIFGLLGACLVLGVAGYGFSVRGILTTLAVNLAYGFSSKHINMLSHAGGFIGGAAVMAAVLAAL